MLKKRKICVITGTRAEYGLLKRLIKAIEDSKEFHLQLIATGMHLSKQFGYTYKEIESDGFTIDKKIDIKLDSDTPAGISKSTSLGIVGFSKSLEELQPDLILILGDRFEILSASIASMFLRIPIAHLHGGELTEGATDEAIRHSITKLSHIHFVASEEYKNRVIQLGEEPKNVFLVGGLGVDAIKSAKLLNRTELEDSLNLKFRKKNILVTFHPVTLEDSTSGYQMKELLKALSQLNDTTIIFTMPNADVDGKILFSLIEDFTKKHSNAYAFTSLGQLKYFSSIAQADCVIGNSSSGLLEVPTFRKATINIGDRQRGRMKAASVIDCDPNLKSISGALKQIYKPEFFKKLQSTKNPYGDGLAVEKIISVLQNISFNNLLKKKFYNFNQ
jgi:GDP/UDP-N,N'-diacetylbacillosamine 2-epimerase (hydrolysing)